MIKSIIILILTLNSSSLWSQVSIKISGSIQDSTGNALPSSYISVLNLHTKTTIHYISTGNQASFSFTIQTDDKDRLALKIVKPGYYDTLVKLEPFKVEYNYLITLKSLTQSMPEVRITSKPFWKNEDTTFYRLNAYTNGVEKNLEEAIKKIPGFNVINGTLFYKNKAVSQILIQGEDIFSDKQSLLLANFPADVIENIQALENQAENKLLKGLSDGNQTVINVTIKKNKIRGFGYLEAGVNSLGKYIVNPLYFSIYRNTKVAVIGNRNNLGYNSSIHQHKEFNNSSSSWNAQWMSPIAPFEQITDLNFRHFLKNNLWDTRVKINQQFGKGIKSETEISYINDRWDFDKSSFENIQADSGNIFKKVKSQSTTEPGKIALQQKFHLTLSGNSALQIKLLGLKDKTKYSSNYYQNLNQSIDTTITFQKFKNHALNILTNFTTRLNSNSAIQIDLNVNNASLHQNTKYGVNNLDEMLSIQPYYNQLNLNRKLSGTDISGKLQLIKKHNGKVLTPTLFHESREVKINHHYFFKDVVTQQPDSTNELLTGNSTIKTHQTEFQFQYGWGKKIRWSMNSSLGWYKLSLNGAPSFESKSTFIGNISGSARKNYKGIQQHLHWSFNKQPMHPIQNLQHPYALNPVNIVIYNSNYISTPNFSVNYLFTRTMRNKHYISANFIQSTTFKNFVYEGNLNRIFQAESFGLKNKANTNYFLSISYMIPMKKRTLLDIEMNANKFASLVSTQGKVLRTFYNQFHSTIKLEKRWKNKHEAELSAGYKLLSIVLPNTLSKNNQGSTNHQINVSGRYLYRIKKGFSLESNFSYFKTQSFTTEKSSLLMSNLVLHYTKKSKPFQLSAYFDNLFNVKHFETLWSAFPVNGSTKIPLIKRNLMISVRYNL